MLDMLFILLLLLFLKHFIIDFPLQKPYQWQNKGSYGHPGGILHAALHGLGTFLVFVLCTHLDDEFYMIAAFLGMLDALIHYHIDWAKMNINRIKGWKCNEHPQFWTLTGFDQFLHALTYLFLVRFFFS